MSLILDLVVVRLGFGLLLLSVVKQSAVVSLFNNVLLNVRFIEVWVRLEAQHLSSDAPHFVLASLRATQQGSFFRQAADDIAMALENYNVF